jgi:CheY-like chemotaxis protein
MTANTVLAIENDRQTAGLLKDTLETAGYAVHASENAGDGFSKARELVPSIIFLNLAAPGANGLEICKTIHSDEALKDVPLVLLTLREGKFDPIYTKLYGIVMFIKKPFTSEHLLSCVREFAPLVPAAGQAEEVFVSMDDTAPELEAEVVEAAEDDSPVYTLEDPDESLEEIGQAFQAAGEVPTVEEPSSLDLQDFKDSLTQIKDEEQDAGTPGPAEFSMESFKEPLAEDAGPDEAGGPVEFDEESLTSPLAYQDSAEAPESEEPAGLEDMEGPSEMALDSFAELTDDDIEAIAGEDAPGEGPLGLDDEPGESMEETVMTEVPEEQPEGNLAAVQPAPSVKKGGSLSARRARKGGGLFRKLVLTSFLLLLVGAGGYAGWYFFLAEEPPALAEIRLPYFDIKLSDIKLPDIDKIKLPRFAQDLIDKAFPPEPEEADPAPSRPAPPPARAENPKPAAAEPVKAKPEAAKPPAPKPAVPRVAKKPVGPFYYVQFGAFKSPANADKFQRKLKRNGLEVFIKSTRADNAPINLVLLRETFNSFERARKEAEAIKSHLGVSTAVYKD